MAKTTRTISLTVPVDLYEEMEAYAKEDERSISYVTTKAVKEFLERKRNITNK